MTSLLQHHCRVAVNRERVTGRRDFLRGVSLAGLAAGTLSWTDLLSLEAAELQKRGMSCILLWMQGGPSQFETFDPKPGHANGGETKAIATNVSGIKIAETYSNLAKVMNDVALVRSVTSKEGSHPRATFLLHSGYLPVASVKYPSLGAIVAHELADKAAELSSFVRIGARRSGSDGGILGNQYDPFDMASANAPPTNTKPATDTSRYERRLGLLGQLESDFATQSPDEVADHQKLYDRAAKMILSPQMKAFDLSSEKDAMRDAYGRNEFGAGCLLARRLVESKVPFVEVTLDGWDTHADNFAKTTELGKKADQGMAQLIVDLKQRGMLDSTLVIWMGEFGRTPKINARGGRDHYPRAFNMALAGGGIRGGQVIGKTDAAGDDVADRPVSVPDLFQTFCKSLKIDASKENTSSIGRPIKIVDGGKPINELFS